MNTTPFVDWPAGERLVLASASPRRAELLATAGIPYRVHPAQSVEAAFADRAAGLSHDPDAYAGLLADAKARAVAADNRDDLVLGADTVVVLDGTILEKPADEADALRLLRLLRGRRHVVVTAISLYDRAAPAWRGAERSSVEFLEPDDDALRRYVATGEPIDKAGAYGIQGYGALMVRRIEGCYFNVMGLPLALLGGALRQVLARRPGRARGRRSDA